jgi:hypothetical protein
MLSSCLYELVQIMQGCACCCKTAALPWTTRLPHPAHPAAPSARSQASVTAFLMASEAQRVQRAAWKTVRQTMAATGE